MQTSIVTECAAVWNAIVQQAGPGMVDDNASDSSEERTVSVQEDEKGKFRKSESTSAGHPIGRGRGFPSGWGRGGMGHGKRVTDFVMLPHFEFSQVLSRLPS